MASRVGPSATAEGDVAVLLRFFGYLGHTNNMRADAFTYLEFLHRVDLGDLVQGFAEWLINVQKVSDTFACNVMYSDVMSCLDICLRFNDFMT